MAVYNFKLPGNLGPKMQALILLVLLGLVIANPSISLNIQLACKGDESRGILAGILGTACLLFLYYFWALFYGCVWRGEGCENLKCCEKFGIVRASSYAIVYVFVLSGLMYSTIVGLGSYKNCQDKIVKTEKDNLNRYLKWSVGVYSGLVGLYLFYKIVWPFLKKKFFRHESWKEENLVAMAGQLPPPPARAQE